jgi:hypothetical protein
MVTCRRPTLVVRMCLYHGGDDMRALNPDEYLVDGVKLCVGDVVWTTENGVDLATVEAILIPHSATAAMWGSPEGGIVLRFGEKNYEIFPDLMGLGLKWERPH